MKPNRLYITVQDESGENDFIVSQNQLLCDFASPFVSQKNIRWKHYSSFSDNAVIVDTGKSFAELGFVNGDILIANI
jgi:hypothetical protein